MLLSGGKHGIINHSLTKCLVLLKQPSRQTATNVPAAEVVGAVRDMLAAAGLPMGAEQMSLLEHSLALQEQLSAADTALVEEQVTWLCLLPLIFVYSSYTLAQSGVFRQNR